MKLSKRILSCFLSFAIAVTMMCGLFVVEAGAVTSATFYDNNAYTDSDGWAHFQIKGTYTGNKPTCITLYYKGSNESNYTSAYDTHFSPSSNYFEYVFDKWFGSLPTYDIISYYYEINTNGEYPYSFPKSPVYTMVNIPLEFSSITASTPSSSSAKLSSKCIFSGNTTPSEVGVRVTDTNGALISNLSDTGISSGQILSYNIYGLAGDTKYYYTFYARYGNVEKTSETKSFITPSSYVPSNNVSFTELCYWSLTQTSIYVSSRVTYTNKAPTYVGAELSKNGGDYYNAYRVKTKDTSDWVNNKNDRFNFPLEDLTPGTEYKFRFYAMIDDVAETYYSDVRSFTTPRPDDFVIENGVLTKYNGTGGDVTIPNGVTAIGKDAFMECTGLTSVVIPNGVKLIGEYAFAHCYNLKNVIISDTVTSIGNRAFCGCINLTGINIPDSVNNIDEFAFYACTSLRYFDYSINLTYIPKGCFLKCHSLTSIDNLSDSITEIGECAFEECSSLKSFIIPKNVKFVNLWTFNKCTDLTAVYFGDSIEGVNSQAFDGCYNLKEIVVSESNSYFSSLNGVLFNKDRTKLVYYPKGITEKEYTIPKGITSIVSWAFKDCSNLTSITIPNSVTSIGAFVFEKSGLTDIYFWGTEIQWNKIEISDYNDVLLNATIHFMGEEKPSNPVVTATAGDEQVTLTWNDMGATKYAAYLVNADGTLKALATKLTDTTYTAKKLTSGTEYTFLVRAYVNGKWTKYDATDYVKATPFSTVVKPTVEVIPADKQVTLTWDAIDGATKYAVYRLQDDGTLKALATKLTVTEYTIKKLVNHTEYQFLVRAYVNGKWTKYDANDYVSATPAALKPLVRVSEYDGMVTLRWGAVDDATKYAAYIVSDDGSLTCVSSKITNIKYTIKNLTNGTAYRFVVRAYVNGKWTKYTDRDIVTATPHA